jgi:hypothetical protein
LPLIVTFVIDSVPEFSIPPPLPSLLSPASRTPPDTVRPEIATLLSDGTVKTRNAGVPSTPPRAIVRTDDPGPAMIKFVERSGKADERLMVPFTEGANLIVSWAERRSAFPMAARSDPGPALWVFKTVIVASKALFDRPGCIDLAVRSNSSSTPRGGTGVLAPYRGAN